MAAVEVEIGLMRIETVPVMRLGYRIPGPVGCLEIFKDDPSVPVPVGFLTPYVEVAPLRSRRRAARPLKPWMLVRCMVNDNFRDDAQSPPMRLVQKSLENTQGAVRRVNVGVIGN